MSCLVKNSVLLQLMKLVNVCGQIMSVVLICCGFVVLSKCSLVLSLVSVFFRVVVLLIVQCICFFMQMFFVNGYRLSLIIVCVSQCCVVVRMLLCELGWVLVIVILVGWRGGEGCIVVGMLVMNVCGLLCVGGFDQLCDECGCGVDWCFVVLVGLVCCINVFDYQCECIGECFWLLCVGVFVQCDELFYQLFFVLCDVFVCWM